MPRSTVCFVLPSLNGGGAERAAVQVLNELDRARWHRLMYLFRREGAYLGDVSPDVEVTAGSADSRRHRAGELCGYLRRTRPDVVVAFLSYFSVLLAARAARIRARVVFNQQTPVTPFLSDGDYRWSRPWHRRTFGIVAQAGYRLADHVLAASRGVAEDLTSHYGVSAEQIDIVHNPIDLNAVEAASVESLDREHDRLWTRPVIVAAGRLAEQKNYPLLIDAVALVRQQMPVRLFILGEGVLNGQLAAHIERRGLQDAVVLCGFQPNPWKYMARADVLALTSKYEGFGNVMVEAMACGVPVVATSSPVTREVVQHEVNGLLVDEHVPTAVAATLERILRDSALRQRLGEGARASAGRFALPAIAAAYDRVLRTVIHR